MISRFQLNRKSITAAVFGDKGPSYFWQAHFWSSWLPLILGLGLGFVLARLIVSDAWPFPLPIVLLVPALVLFSRYPFAAVFIWILVFPFFVRAPGSAGRYVYWILHRAMIPMALMSVILSDWLGIRKRRETVRLGAPEWAMAAFVALTVANMVLISPDPAPKLINFYDRMLIPFAMYLLIRLAAPNEEDLKRLLWVALIAVSVQIVIGLASWFAPSLLPDYWLGLQGQRTVGTLGNPAVYSSTLIFLSLLLFHYAMSCESTRTRNILLAVTALAFFCVFFTFSRGSWLGGAVVLLGLILLFPGPVIRMTIVVTAVIAFLSTSLLADEVAWAVERLNTENTAEGRIVGYNAAISMIEQRPLFGWGYGEYDRYSERFKTRVLNIAVRSESTSHNTYLTLMAESGVLTFLLFLFPLGYWLIGSVKAWRWIPRKGFINRTLLVLLWLLMVDHFIVSNFMDMIRYNQFGTTVWWMALGLIATIVYPYLGSRDVRASWANSATDKSRL